MSLFQNTQARSKVPLMLAPEALSFPAVVVPHTTTLGPPARTLNVGSIPGQRMTGQKTRTRWSWRLITRDRLNPLSAPRLGKASRCGG